MCGSIPLHVSQIAHILDILASSISQDLEPFKATGLISTQKKPGLLIKINLIWAK
jgi:DNA-binding transcriptional regulator GbsR (MarR family)